MEKFKNANSQIGNPSPSRDKLNRARDKFERPSITKLREAHQLVKAAENPVVVIPNAIGAEALQRFLNRLDQLKTSSNTIITDPSIDKTPNNTVVPGPSIDKTPANGIKPSALAKLRELKHSQSPVS